MTIHPNQIYLAHHLKSRSSN